MNASFTSSLPGTTVIFGPGARHGLAEALDELGTRRPFLVAQPHLADELTKQLSSRWAGSTSATAQHVPSNLVDEVSTAVELANADALVAAGGGSSIGLAKGIALASRLPIIAIPTSYAGSEMTSIWGVTREGKKTTGRDVHVRPKRVIYDPELLETLPSPMAAASGLNALAHSVESLYASNADPMTLVVAEESVRALGTHLEAVVTHNDEVARSGALVGSWLAGFCLDRVQMGVHHKLCHTLGGSFGMPHAEVHAVVLPYAVAFNAQAAPEAMARLRRALDTNDPAAAIYRLAERVGSPLSLERIGMKEEDLERAATIASEHPYANPRPVDHAGLNDLLRAAFAGQVPRST